MSQSNPILNTTASPPPSRGTLATTHPKSYTYYHAGPLFTLADLHGNTLLSRAIRTRSRDKFLPVVPQDLEQRDLHAHSIRDQDLRALLNCDLALFVFDGAELDSGTVVEFMTAKMADVPCVVLRTDFRGGGDQGGGGARTDPWNLMCSFWPRCERVVVDGMVAYKTGLAARIGGGAESDGGSDRTVRSERALVAGELMLEEVAREVVEAFERVLQKPPVMPLEVREHVYEWLALMPGYRDGMVEGNAEAMQLLCREKAAKGLL